MVEDQKIMQSIYGAVDDVNSQVDSSMHLGKTPDTVLFGPSSALDSFGLVSLIVAIEQKIQEDFGLAVTIADEKAFSQKNSPFRTIGTLAVYVSTLIEERRHG